MRAVRFVKRLEWDLPGTVFRHGMTIGDVDNDGDNELVVGTAEGDVYIFKGSEIWQKITGLGLITCVSVGDVFNYGCNALVVICGNGWAHIYYSPRSVNPGSAGGINNPLDISANNFLPSSSFAAFTAAAAAAAAVASSTTDSNNESHGKMECVHLQRIPTNTKVVIIADVDQDGANEMIIGLTDRVVRSYRWSTNTDLGTGKLVGLFKWECANQIGTVTVQHTSDNVPTLLVSQPGGTFMRIKCNNPSGDVDDDDAATVDYQTLGISRMRNPNISTEIIGDLEPGDCRRLLDFRRNLSQHQLPIINSNSNNNNNNNDVDDMEKLEQSQSTRFYGNLPEIDQIDGSVIGGNVIIGNIDKSMSTPSSSSSSSSTSSPSIHEDLESMGNTGKPYALATLDGTIMLVKDETILWAMQVDHQIFALCRLDVTRDGADEIVACTWDGQTYILDQQRRSVRFQFGEPVRAFITGMYNVKPGTSTPCLVYNTFSNKLIVYHDVTMPSMLISRLNPLETLEPDQREIVRDAINAGIDPQLADEKLRNLTEYLLYGM